MVKSSRIFKKFTLLNQQRKVVGDIDDRVIALKKNQEACQKLVFELYKHSSLLDELNRSMPIDVILNECIVISESTEKFKSWFISINSEFDITVSEANININ